MNERVEPEPMTPQAIVAGLFLAASTLLWVASLANLLVALR